MKLLFVLAIFTMLSAQAIACPNLSGKYLCHDEEFGQDYESRITQRAVAGGAVYTVTSQGESNDLIADGKRHELEGGDFPVFYIAKCQDNVVNAMMEGEIEENGVVVGKLDGDFKYYVKDNELISEGITTITYHGQTHTMNDREACKKL